MSIQLPLPYSTDTWESWARTLVAELENNLGSVVATSSTGGSAGLPITDSSGRTIVDTDGIHIFDTAGFEVIDANLVQIDTSHLVDAAIETAKLANSSVSTEKIANLAVGTAQIANLAVTSALIGNAAIVNAKIADLAVTDAKINDISANKITVGTLDAGVIQVVNLSATNINVGSLNANRLSYNGTMLAVDGSGNLLINTGGVNTAQLADGSITDVKVGNLSAAKITTGTLSADRIDLDGTSLTSSGGTLQVNGVDFATQVTGAAKPDDGATRNVWQGAWQSSGVSYAVGDIVSYMGRAYTCTVANTSTGSNGPSGTTADTANWDLFVDAGSTSTPVAETAGAATTGIASLSHTSLGNEVKVTFESFLFGSRAGSPGSLPTSSTLTITSDGTTIYTVTFALEWAYDSELDASFWSATSAGTVHASVVDTPGVGANTYATTWSAGVTAPFGGVLSTLEYP